MKRIGVRAYETDWRARVWSERSAPKNSARCYPKHLLRRHRHHRRIFLSVMPRILVRKTDRRMVLRCNRHQRGGQRQDHTHGLGDVDCECFLILELQRSEQLLVGCHRVWEWAQQPTLRFGGCDTMYVCSSEFLILIHRH